MSEKKFSLKKIAIHLDGKIIGDENIEVEKILPLDLADEKSISFLYNKKFIDNLSISKAAAIVLEDKYESLNKSASIVVDDAHIAYAKLTQLFKNIIDKTGVNPNAFINSENIDASSYIGPMAIIEEGAVIGKNVKILGSVFIGKEAKVGDNTIIYPNVTIYSETKIGNNCIIHANSVLGSDGLGFANKKGNWEKIEHLGIVNVKNDVEIGSGCTIDKSSTGETLLKSGVKLDNQVHIAHNCEIGKNTIIGAKTAIAGSTTIGRGCKIGGGCGIIDNIKLCDDVTVTPMSFVTKSILKKGIYSGGSMLMEHKSWLKYSAELNRKTKK